MRTRAECTRSGRRPSRRTRRPRTPSRARTVAAPRATLRRESTRAHTAPLRCRRRPAAPAEVLTNLHAFATIVTNHCGDDLYRFGPSCKVYKCTVRQSVAPPKRRPALLVVATRRPFSSFVRRHVAEWRAISPPSVVSQSPSKRAAVGIPRRGDASQGGDPSPLRSVRAARASSDGRRGEPTALTSPVAGTTRARRGMRRRDERGGHATCSVSSSGAPPHHL